MITLLRREKYDLAVDFISTPGSSLLTFLTGAKQRIGYRLRYRTWAYTHPVKRHIEPVYNPLTKFDLVKGINVDSSNLQPEVYIDELDREFANRVWQRFMGDEYDLVIAVAPWSKREWRRWNLESLLKVMREVSEERDICWILFADERERQELEVIENDPDLDVKWAGARNMLQAAALIQCCKAMLCVDNGLKHVSVAVSTPALTIFTGSDPVVWNPPDDEKYPYLNFYDRSGYVAEIEEVSGKLIQLLKSNN